MVGGLWEMSLVYVVYDRGPKGDELSVGGIGYGAYGRRA